MNDKKPPSFPPVSPSSAPVATRPVGKREALDASLAEAVLRMKNDPTLCVAPFEIMKDTIASAPDAETCCFLLKKLVATALSSWTLPTCDAAAFAEAAALADFQVASYGKTTTVVREPAYSSTTGPLLKSVCGKLCQDVFKPAHKRLRSYKKQGREARKLAEHLDALLRAGSLEKSTSEKLPPAPRFSLE